MRNFEGLIKIAFGTQTVGDFMNAWNADLSANPTFRQQAFAKINAAGLNVKQPASRIPYVLGGGVLGNIAAKYLGANSFWKGVATVGGALYGNSVFNKNHPNPAYQHVAPGVVRRGF